MLQSSLSGAVSAAWRRCLDFGWGLTVHRIYHTGQGVDGGTGRCPVALAGEALGGVLIWHLRFVLCGRVDDNLRDGVYLSCYRSGRGGGVGLG